MSEAPRLSVPEALAQYMVAIRNADAAVKASNEAKRASNDAAQAWLDATIAEDLAALALKAAVEAAARA